MDSLALSYSIAHRPAEAIKLLEEVLALRRNVTSPEDLNMYGTMVNLSGLYRLSGEVAKAESLEQEIAAIARAKREPKQP
jgi:hypothetical protein